jgi:uncharacterized phage protein (TIGR02218 family)
MRAVDPALQADLDAGATTLCRCWRIERADGAAFGFTEHDAPLRFDETDFEPRCGLDGAALERATGLAAGDTEILGAVSSDGIAEADIARGLFDGARVTLWLVDWRAPARRHLLFAGTIGRIERDGARFTAEVEGPAAALRRRSGRAILPVCDARFGDARCCADAAGHTVAGTVAAVDAAGQVSATGLGAFSAGWFDGGALRWTSGANAGTESVVRRQERGDPARLTLWTAPAAAVAPGDAFTVTAGCDKRFETCREKFGNGLNFRGFPHVPGDDWVAAHPAPGDRHDGRSRTA